MQLERVQAERRLGGPLETGVGVDLLLARRGQGPAAQRALAAEAVLRAPARSGLAVIEVQRVELVVEGQGPGTGRPDLRLRLGGIGRAAAAGQDEQRQDQGGEHAHGAAYPKRPDGASEADHRSLLKGSSA